MMLPGREILALHRAITAIPSVSGNEAALADFLEAKLRRHGAKPERIGNSLLARIGSGPVLLLDTHLDTVPPAPGWTRDPFRAGGGGRTCCGAPRARPHALIVERHRRFLGHRRIHHARVHRQRSRRSRFGRHSGAGAAVVRVALHRLY